jgi:hypothetical protein
MKHFRPSHPHAIPGLNQSQLSIDWNKAPRGLGNAIIAGGNAGWHRDLTGGPFIATNDAGATAQQFAYYRPLNLDWLGPWRRETPYGFGIDTLSTKVGGDGATGALCSVTRPPQPINDEASFEFWFYVDRPVDSTSRHFGYLSQDTPAAGTATFNAYYDGATGTLKAFWYGPPSGPANVDTGITPVEGRLYQFVCVNTGTATRLYVNGALVATSGDGHDAVAVYAAPEVMLFSVGASAAGYNDWPILSGFYANVAWSTDEVQARYADPYGFLKLPIESVFPVGRVAPAAVAGDYFGNRYFGARHYGRRYFGSGTAAASGSSGAASGAGTASGIGLALVSAAGAASGAGSAAGIGAALASSAGSASGAGATAGAGRSIASGAGSAAGAGAANGVGSSIASSVGSASGTGAAAGVATGGASGVGSASGSGAAAGVGVAVVSAVGTAAGSGTTAGAGLAVKPAIGAAGGSGASAGIGRALSSGTGEASGSGATAGAGRAVLAAVGVAAGVGTANGFSIEIVAVAARIVYAEAEGRTVYAEAEDRVAIAE